MRRQATGLHRTAKRRQTTGPCRTLGGHRFAGIDPHSATERFAAGILRHAVRRYTAVPTEFFARLAAAVFFQTVKETALVAIAVGVRRTPDPRSTIDFPSRFVSNQVASIRFVSRATAEEPKEEDGDDNQGGFRAKHVFHRSKFYGQRNLPNRCRRSGKSAHQRRIELDRLATIGLLRIIVKICPFS